MNNYRLVNNKETLTKEEVYEELKHYRKAMEDKIKIPYEEKLKVFNDEKLKIRLDGKVKNEFIDDFINLKQLNNDMTDEELTKIIDDNKVYKVENIKATDIKENKNLKKTIEQGEKIQEKDYFDTDNPCFN